LLTDSQPGYIFDQAPPAYQQWAPRQQQQQQQQQQQRQAPPPSAVSSQSNGIISSTDNEHGQGRLQQLHSMEDELKTMAREYMAMRQQLELHEQECRRKYGAAAVTQLKLPQHPLISIPTRVNGTMRMLAPAATPVPELCTKEPADKKVALSELMSAELGSTEQTTTEPGLLKDRRVSETEHALKTAVATAEAEERMKCFEQDLAALRNTNAELVAAHAAGKASSEDADLKRREREELEAMVPKEGGAVVPKGTKEDAGGGGGGDREGGEKAGSKERVFVFGEEEGATAEMKAEMELFAKTKAQQEAADRTNQQLSDLATCAAFVLVLLLGTVVFKYNQVIETDCTGDLPKGFEPVEILTVVNCTESETDKTYKVYYQLDGTGITLSYTANESKPAGTYASSPDVPVCTRQWTWAEGFYYGMVTATTVGYGDYGPANDNMKIWCIIYISLALVMAGSVIGIGTRYLESFQKLILDHLDDNPDDMDEPQGYKVVLSFTLVVLTVITGTIFFAYNEGWSFLDAFYWSFITCATIGYGDMSLSKDSSRLFSFFYLLVSTTFFAHGLGNILGIQEEIAREERRILVMRNNSNIKTMLAKHSIERITSGEYLGAYLFEMGLVSDGAQKWIPLIPFIDPTHSIH
jgi:hypothetical protein